MTDNGYGINYGSLQSNTAPTNPGDETMPTNLPTLQANDALILQGSILRATAQSEGFAIYVHQMKDDSVELIQESAESSKGYVQITLKTEGKQLIKEVLG